MRLTRPSGGSEGDIVSRRGWGGSSHFFFLFALSPFIGGCAVGSRRYSCCFCACSRIISKAPPSNAVSLRQNQPSGSEAPRPSSRPRLRRGAVQPPARRPLLGFDRLGQELGQSGPRGTGDELEAQPDATL